MALPVDVPLSYTLDFVRRHVRPGWRVLEVGCGNGRLAREMTDLGCLVVAIDCDAEAIAAARSLGVDARQAAWPHFEDGPFDAVMFTRSLHHVTSLDLAVACAARALEPGGRLVIEDFAFAEVDEPTAAWLRRVVREEHAEGALVPPPGSLAERMLRDHDPLQAWHQEAHAIHPWGDIERLLHGAAERLETASAAYLFRYVVEALPPTENGARLASRILRDEQAAIARREIRGLGRRWVGQTAGVPPREVM